MIAEVCRLYTKPEDRIADITYGRGRFWSQWHPEGGVTGSDLIAEAGVQVVCDFTELPYADKSFDIVVFDPPYCHNSGTSNPHDYGAPTTRYNGQTTAGMYNADIMELYLLGMMEAKRVLNPDGGMCWVKCKDEVEREVQRWSHIRIYEMAIQIGFCARDLFVLAGTTSPQRWPDRVQRHARKTHSYLWIFQLPDDRYRKLLSRAPPRKKEGTLNEKRR